MKRSTLLVCAVLILLKFTGTKGHFKPLHFEKPSKLSLWYQPRIDPPQSPFVKAASLGRISANKIHKILNFLASHPKLLCITPPIVVRDLFTALSYNPSLMSQIPRPDLLSFLSAVSVTQNIMNSIPPSVFLSLIQSLSITDLSALQPPLFAHSPPSFTVELPPPVSVDCDPPGRPVSPTVPIPSPIPLEPYSPDTYEFSTSSTPSAPSPSLALVPCNTAGISGVVSGGVGAGVSGGVGAGVSGGVSTGVSGGVGAGVSGGVSGGVGAGVNAGIGTGVNVGVNVGVGGGVNGGINAGFIAAIPPSVPSSKPRPMVTPLSPQPTAPTLPFPLICKSGQILPNVFPAGITQETIIKLLQCANSAVHSPTIFPNNINTAKKPIIPIAFNESSKIYILFPNNTIPQAPPAYPTVSPTPEIATDPTFLPTSTPVTEPTANSYNNDQTETIISTVFDDHPTVSENPTVFSSPEVPANPTVTPCPIIPLDLPLLSDPVKPFNPTPHLLPEVGLPDIPTPVPSEVMTHPALLTKILYKLGKIFEKLPNKQLIHKQLPVLTKLPKIPKIPKLPVLKPVDFHLKINYPKHIPLKKLPILDKVPC